MILWFANRSRSHFVVYPLLSLSFPASCETEKHKKCKFLLFFIFNFLLFFLFQISFSIQLITISFDSIPLNESYWIQFHSNSICFSYWFTFFTLFNFPFCLILFFYFWSIFNMRSFYFLFLNYICKGRYFRYLVSLWTRELNIKGTLVFNSNWFEPFLITEVSWSIVYLISLVKSALYGSTGLIFVNLEWRDYCILINNRLQILIRINSVFGITKD